ncbi:MAG: hypothetical protein AAGF81_00420 [Pseudomonadota bacterium]
MGSLLEDLRAYDGKAVTLLSEAHARHGGAASYLADLVALSAHDELHVSDGATWLLKASLEKGNLLSPSETDALLANLEKIVHWPAQLHVCQMLDALTVPEEAAPPLADWLSGLLKHERPFLRAWSMSALHALAAQHPAFDRQAKSALEAAETDASAAVRVRARNLET